MIIAGTGHRPKDLPCSYNEEHPWLIKIKKNLIRRIEEVKPEAIISGLAIGWDQWLAKAALYCEIPLWSYIPFKGQESKWPQKSQETYRELINKSEKVKIIGDKSNARESFLNRNIAMINDCDLVFALWSGKNWGGTVHAINYATKINKQIENFWENP